MRGWNRELGFRGTLKELLDAMWMFYPPRASIAAVQDWLVRRAQSATEVFICRGYSPLKRGAWYGNGADNAILTTDNEFATSLYGISMSEEAVVQLTSGTLMEAFKKIPGVTLCWALGDGDDEAEVRATHVLGGIETPPTGCTKLYPIRTSQKLKLAHLVPAADDIASLQMPERERIRLRMFRSLSPLNMYPLPRANRAFTHRMTLHGEAQRLHKNDLGETQDVLDCVLAYLEDRYRQEGFGAVFEAYAKHALIALDSLDLSGMRAKSGEMQVVIEPKGGTPSYNDLVAWAKAIVGNSCAEQRKVGESFSFTIDEFVSDESYNRKYVLKDDSHTSALRYFLLLNERHGGDPNLVFRPGRAGDNGSRKALLRHEDRDIEEGRAELNPRTREVMGWNVYAAG